MKTRRKKMTMDTFYFLVRQILSTYIFATPCHKPSMLTFNSINISQHSLGMCLLASLIPRLPYDLFIHLPLGVLTFFKTLEGKSQRILGLGCRPSLPFIMVVRRNCFSDINIKTERLKRILYNTVHFFKS